MLQQPTTAPAGFFAERFRARIGQRAAGIAAALLLEALLLLLLLSLGREGSRGEETVTIVDFEAFDSSEPAPDPAEPEPERAESAAPRPTPREIAPPPPPVEAPPTPPVAPPIPIARTPAPPSEIGVGPRPIQSPPPAGPVSGPANTGGSSGDTARVGTAPNGEPLYAARWYREPYEDELRGYLSTASGPGWGLIACRTAPDFRVEDCVGISEYPQGSQYLRAILAASWQFKVRPPRRGGQSLVGAWVRIRIIQTIDGRSAPGS